MKGRAGQNCFLWDFIRNEVDNMDFLPALNGEYQEMGGSFKFPYRFSMQSKFREAEGVFAERMHRFGGYRIDRDTEVVVFYEEKAGLSGQEYELRIMDGKVTVSASGMNGYIYGLTTLFQMIVRGKGAIPNCFLRDRPRFQVRGVMLDVCRHFFSVAEVKKVIEQCALLKMTRFHWHLSDDQGFRIESADFTELNQIGPYRKLAKADAVVAAGLAEAGTLYGGLYTREEIRDVVSFVAARGIEIIPEIDLPGHCSAILAAYPQLSCSGKPLKVKNTFGVHDRIFCAGKEESYQFLYKLMDEICELFPAEFIHLGGDEVPKTAWHDCPLCNRVMKEKGLGSYENLQAFFMDKVIQYLKKRAGKRLSGMKRHIQGNWMTALLCSTGWRWLRDQVIFCRRQQREENWYYPVCIRCIVPIPMQRCRFAQHLCLSRR